VLAAVHQQDGYPTRWPADPANWLAPRDLLKAWVDVEDEALSGHIAVVTGVDDPLLVQAASWPAEQLAAISRLFVAPGARGAGRGQQLLETAMTYAAQHGLGLVLDVVEDQRSAAIRLYERLGWRFVGHRQADWTTPTGARPQLRLYILESWP
jgi:GNAT superfamily N-acetyltransferase